MEQAGVQGVQVAVLSAGRRHGTRRSFRHAETKAGDRRLVFEAASLSKPCSPTALTLVDAGLLDLDTPSRSTCQAVRRRRRHAARRDHAGTSSATGADSELETRRDP